MIVKKSHKYFLQIQGQMGISRHKKSYFIVYTFEDLFWEIVPFDETFFNDNMVPVLKKFYEAHYRPYIAAQLLTDCIVFSTKFEAIYDVVFSIRFISDDLQRWWSAVLGRKICANKVLQQSRLNLENITPVIVHDNLTQYVL